MDNTEKKLLKDILTCIESIESYLGNSKKFEEYDTDFLIQDAVERNLITIGEAMNRLLVLLPEVSITNSRRVVDARNKLTHGYDEIENVQVWSILINHLPILKAEVKSLLDE
jgi:uncharacterized protein with HEPN domain